MRKLIFLVLMLGSFFWTPALYAGGGSIKLPTNPSQGPFSLASGETFYFGSYISEQANLGSLCGDEPNEVPTGYSGAYYMDQLNFAPLRCCSSGGQKIVDPGMRCQYKWVDPEQPNFSLESSTSSPGAIKHTYLPSCPSEDCGFLVKDRTTTQTVLFADVVGPVPIEVIYSQTGVYDVSIYNKYAGNRLELTKTFPVGVPAITKPDIRISKVSQALNVVSKDFTYYCYYTMCEVAIEDHDRTHTFNTNAGTHVYNYGFTKEGSYFAKIKNKVVDTQETVITHQVESMVPSLAVKSSTGAVPNYTVQIEANCKVDACSISMEVPGQPRFTKAVAKGSTVFSYTFTVFETYQMTIANNDNLAISYRLPITAGEAEPDIKVYSSSGYVPNNEKTFEVICRSPVCGLDIQDETGHHVSEISNIYQYPKHIFKVFGQYEARVYSLSNSALSKKITHSPALQPPDIAISTSSGFVPFFDVKYLSHCYSESCGVDVVDDSGTHLYQISKGSSYISHVYKAAGAYTTKIFNTSEIPRVDVVLNHTVEAGPMSCVEGSQYLKSGESFSFGSYPKFGENGCCKDQSGEFPVTTEDRKACCAGSYKIVNAAGQCVIPTAAPGCSIAGSNIKSGQYNAFGSYSSFGESSCCSDVTYEKIVARGDEKRCCNGLGSLNDKFECTTSSACFGYPFMESGENSTHGGYTSRLRRRGEEMCCGNESGEFPKRDGGSFVCCNNPNDVVLNGQCVVAPQLPPNDAQYCGGSFPYLASGEQQRHGGYLGNNPLGDMDCCGDEQLEHLSEPFYNFQTNSYMYRCCAFQGRVLYDIGGVPKCGGMQAVPAERPPRGSCPDNAYFVRSGESFNHGGYDKLFNYGCCGDDPLESLQNNNNQWACCADGKSTLNSFGVCENNDHRSRTKYLEFKFDLKDGVTQKCHSPVVRTMDPKKVFFRDRPNTNSTRYRVAVAKNEAISQDAILSQFPISSFNAIVERNPNCRSTGGTDRSCDTTIDSVQVPCFSDASYLSIIDNESNTGVCKLKIEGLCQ